MWCEFIQVTNTAKSNSTINNLRIIQWIKQMLVWLEQSRSEVNFRSCLHFLQEIT